MREVTMRARELVDSRCVISLIEYFDGDEDEHFMKELERRNLHDYPYCVVMRAGDKTLQDVMNNEIIAGEDWSEIKNITHRLATTLHSLHEQGIVHGDVKPTNVVRLDARYMLIDFDSSASIGNTSSSSKYSSAYLPPELIYVENDVAVVKRLQSSSTIGMDDEVDFEYEVISQKLPELLLPSSPAHDVWALGLVLYELCSGVKFFIQVGSDDD
jgi:serine/threonine protein kinase